MDRRQSLIASFAAFCLCVAGGAVYGQELKHRGTLDWCKAGGAGWVQFDAKEKILVGYCSPEIKVWEWPARKVVTAIDPGKDGIDSLTLHPNGKQLAFGAAKTTGVNKLKGFIKIWDLEKKEAIFSWQDTVEAEPFGCYVALHPHKKLLAFAWGNHNAILWDYDKNRRVFELRGHTKMIRNIAFSPDGDSLITGGDDFSLKRWDVGTGRCTGTIAENLGRIESLCFRRDGKSLYVGSWYTLREVDMTAFKTSKTMKNQHRGPASGLVLIRDESVLVSVYYAPTARLYDLRSDKNLPDWLMPEHREKTLEVWREWLAPHSDGRVLITANGGGRIDEWEVQAVK